MNDRNPDRDRDLARVPESEYEQGYDEWTVAGESREDDLAYVGFADGYGPIFHASSEGALYGGRIDEENEELVPDTETIDVSPGDTVGEALERLGEGAGWRSLSEYGRSLQDDG